MVDKVMEQTADRSKRSDSQDEQEMCWCATEGSAAYLNFWCQQTSELRCR
jgi:hypothetical protein